MRFNTIYTKFLGLTLALVLGLLNLVPAFAAGTTQIKMDSTSANVGDSVNVTVSGSESGTISLKYNNNVLELTNVGGATVNGNIVSFTGTSVNLSFKAIAAGNGDLVVSSDTLTGSSTSIGVAEKADEEEKKEEEVKEEENKEEDAADGDFTIDGKAYVLSERFTDEEIPKGFSKKSMEFSSGTYNELASDFMTLVYLKPASDTSQQGVFYIYNADDNSVEPFNTLGSGGSYVILQTASDLFSDSLEEVSFKVGEKEYTGYQVKDISNDFYFVYGTDNSGESGWYQFDSKKNTIQRANTEVVGTGTASEEKEEGRNNTTSKAINISSFSDSLNKLKNTRMLLGILVFAAAVLLIIIIDIILFRRGNDEDDVFDELDDEMDDGPVDYSGTPTVEDIRAQEEDEEFEEQNDRKSGKKNKYEENDVEVFTLDDVLDDVEDDLSTDIDKGKSKKGLFGRKSKDIWDKEDDDDGTGGLPAIDDRSKLRKQVFKNTSSEVSEASEGKVDLLDLNDM